MRTLSVLLMSIAVAGCARTRAAGPSSAAGDLARVERQIEEFYGPMLFLVEESRLAIEDVLHHLDREYVFPTDGPLPENERRYWLFRAENDLMPRNEEMVALIMAKRHLVEGDKLPKILDELEAHQVSWRELHRRWKEKGVEYSWHSESPFPRNLGTVLAREFARLMERRRELLPQVPGAERRHVQRQIEELYGPLVRGNRESWLAMQGLLMELGRPSVFPLDPAKEEGELALWQLWCDEVFAPGNEALRLTIKRGLHLVEGTEMPAGFLAFLDHWNSWKMERLRAKVQRVSCGIRSKSRFPVEEYGEAVDETFAELTSRWVRLRGGR